jgi:hypothetical protein
MRARPSPTAKTVTATAQQNRNQTTGDKIASGTTRNLERAA